MENNDYELVSLAQENNEEAIKILYQKYKPIIIKKSEHAILYLSHHGIEINDIMQEGFIALDEAIKKFSQNDTASFYTFATLCISRKISTYIKRMQGKNKILNDAIAIDEGIENLLKDSFNVETSVISCNEEVFLLAKIQKTLTSFEKDVFNLKIKGYSFEEIANTLNKETKAIYNSFHRIKQKIKKIVDDDNWFWLSFFTNIV